jgi:hypothetical protein
VYTVQYLKRLGLNEYNYCAADGLPGTNVISNAAHQKFAKPVRDFNGLTPKPACESSIGWSMNTVGDYLPAGDSVKMRSIDVVYVNVIASGSQAPTGVNDCVGAFQLTGACSIKCRSVTTVSGMQHATFKITRRMLPGGKACANIDGDTKLNVCTVPNECAEGESPKRVDDDEESESDGARATPVRMTALLIASLIAAVVTMLF